jgi:hypothetical protein
MKQQTLVPQVATLQHFSPPTARELRAQAVHRLQIGLFGLAVILLVIGLANIIMQRARMSEALAAGRTAEEAAASPSQASDPLADIGLIPSPGSDQPARKGARR